MKALPFLALCGSLALAACNGSRGATATGAAPAASVPAHGADAVVAEVGDTRITAGEVDALVRGQLLKVRQQEYELRRQALDTKLNELLLKREAAARGLTVEELVTREINQRVPKPGAAEVAAFYEKVKGQVGGRPLEEVRPQLEAFLARRASDTRRDDFFRELGQKHGLKVTLPAPRFEIPLAPDAVVTGPADAPITVVEYTDYECPFCRRAQETLDQLMERYKGKLRVVHRDYPLDNHPRARAAAVAVYCAGEQGRFWEYRRHVLVEPGDLGDEDLRRRASGLKLDPGAFGSCLASGRHDAVIQRGLQEGQGLGVDSTPTFFVNGRMVSGAQPLEYFVKLIDEELQARGRS